MNKRKQYKWITTEHHNLEDHVNAAARDHFRVVGSVLYAGIVEEANDLFHVLMERTDPEDLLQPDPTRPEPIKVGPPEHHKSNFPNGDQLEPCPFCTNEEAFQLTWYRIGSTQHHRVTCKICGTAGPIRNTTQQAIHDWNIRQTPEEL